MAKSAFVISVLCLLAAGCGGAGPSSGVPTIPSATSGVPGQGPPGGRAHAGEFPISGCDSRRNGHGSARVGSCGNRVGYCGSRAGQLDGWSRAGWIGVERARLCHPHLLPGWRRRMERQAWSPMTTEPDTGIPSIIACTSATSCSAISDDQYTVWDGSSWHTSKNFYQDGGPQGGVSINSMSCPSPTFCAAADRTYGYVYVFDGKNWTTDKATVDQAVADATAGVNAGGTGNVVFDTVACSSETFCALVDGAGNARTFDGKAWSQSTSVASKTANGSPALDCPDQSSCVAEVGNAVSTWDGSAWKPASDVPTYAAASCAAADMCTLVGVNGAASDWASFNGQDAIAGSAIPASNSPGPCRAPICGLLLGHRAVRLVHVEVELNSRAGHPIGPMLYP